MRSKVLLTISLIGAVAVFSVGASAQHEEHHPESQATQPQAQTPTRPSPEQRGRE